MFPTIIAVAAILIAQAAGNAEPSPPTVTGDSTMAIIETKRLVLRPFTAGDSSDVHALAADWAKAPGPAFDKWPTSEEETRGLTNHFAGDTKYFAMCVRKSGKVVGLLALNGIDADRQLDLGHVILSEYQDGKHDKEALGAMVDHVFRTMDVAAIVTHNDPAHAEQLAPLKALGFRNANEAEKGELVLTKKEWERSGKR